MVDISKFTVLKDPMQNHSEALSRNLKDAFLDQKYCDITFKVNEKRFLAHKVILGARSQVFAAMFEHKMAETLSGEVNITDADPDIFYDVLLYIYSGSVQTMSINSGNMCQYYKLADKYDLRDLKFFCQKLIESDLSESNIYDILILADMYSEANLKQFAIQFLVNNAEKLFQTDQWKKFRSEHLNLAFEILEAGILKKTKIY